MAASQTQWFAYSSNVQLVQITMGEKETKR